MTASCPRCGTTATMGAFGVCAPCAAQLGWEPECAACAAEQDGRPVEVAHGDNCADGNRADPVETDINEGADHG